MGVKKISQENYKSRRKTLGRTPVDYRKRKFTSRYSKYSYRFDL